MWVVFGVGAIITALLNVVWMLFHRETKWFRFISLSLTALTVCAFYSRAGRWVLAEDWSALMDVVPSVSVILWILTAASVIINGMSLFQKEREMT